MTKFNLTYIITTRNKLPMLKQVITRLLTNIKEDEEIVITDGSSNDGTKEYLQALHDEGKIHQFLSEPDCGEAHGYNKAFLMARGDIIKVLTDDDIFYYPGIQKCKEFMMSNPQIDVLSSNGAGFQGQEENPCQVMSYNNDYEIWKTNLVPFSFCGLGLMIRRTSLPFLGLFNTAFTRVDYEYALRITSLKINMAWYTRYCWLRIANPQSNSTVYIDKMETEAKRLDKLYLSDQENIELPKKGLSKILNDMERNIRYKVRKKKNLNHKICNNNSKNTDFYEQIDKIFDYCDKWINEQNIGNNNEFLIK